MPKLDAVSGKQMMKILLVMGFELKRIKGSHHYFFHPLAKKTASVPVHRNETLGIGLLKAILRDIDLSSEEFEKLRKQI